MPTYGYNWWRPGVRVGGLWKRVVHHSTRGTWERGDEGRGRTSRRRRRTWVELSRFCFLNRSRQKISPHLEREKLKVSGGEGECGTPRERRAWPPSPEGQNERRTSEAGVELRSMAVRGCVCVLRTKKRARWWAPQRVGRSSSLSLYRSVPKAEDPRMDGPTTVSSSPEDFGLWYLLLVQLLPTAWTQRTRVSKGH